MSGSAETAAAEKEIEQLWAKIEDERQKCRDVDGTRGYLEQVPNWTSVGRRKIENLKTLKGHLEKVYALQWGGEDGQNIVSASQDGKLLVWDAVTGNKISAVRLQNSWVMTCAYSGLGSLVAAGGLDNCCTIYQLNDEGKELCKLEGHTGYISSCHFLNDDKKMLTSSGDHTCKLWDIETDSREITCFRGHGEDVVAVTLAKDELTMITGASDRLCKRWDIRSGQCVQTFQTNNPDINSVVLHPSGNAFACATDISDGQSGECLLFDIRADQCIAEYSTEDAGNDDGIYGITCVDFSTSGSILYAGMDCGTVVGWDVITEEEVVNSKDHKKGHEKRVNCLQVSPDGAVLATGSWDSTLKLWN